METGERIEILEEQYGALTEQLGALTLQNQTILQQLGQLIQQSQVRQTGASSPVTPITTPPTPPAHPIPADLTSNLKAALPNEFTGDRANGRAFLNSCELYIRLARSKFVDEATMVHWALSFMKSGRASLFAHRVLRSEARTGTPRFTTWAEFRTSFTTEFCPKNETQLALAKLETPGYYQGRRSVDDYVDDFRELIDQAGYKEGLAIVVKFRRGLQREIQDQIAQLAIGRPPDDDPESWYDAAIRSDENRTANALFHGGTRALPPPRTTSLFSSPRPTPASQPAWQNRSTPSSLPPRATPTSVPPPTDIDMSRKKMILPVACHRCGKIGHFSRECPQRYDIRFMSQEEREECFEGWALQADAGELLERTEEAEGLDATEQAEDFVERSG
jgi:Retrotransposon gag protein/Zinc knuckle